MWGASCTFSLTPYTDSGTKEMNIIRDWKELVNQVNQLLQLQDKNPFQYKYHEMPNSLSVYSVQKYK